MSKSFFDELGELVLLYKFRYFILFSGIIGIVIFIWGYYKFAVPVYNKYENRSIYVDQIDSNYEYKEYTESFQDLIQTPEQEEHAYEQYLEDKNEISKAEITQLRNNLLDAFKKGKGIYIVYEKDKQAISKCCKELLVKYLDSTYSFKEHPNGSYGPYYSLEINGEVNTAVDAEYTIDKLVKRKYGYILEDYPNTYSLKRLN